jgi:hypothetical protein
MRGRKGEGAGERSENSGGRQFRAISGTTLTEAGASFGDVPRRSPIRLKPRFDWKPWGRSGSFLFPRSA